MEIEKLIALLIGLILMIVTWWYYSGQGKLTPQHLYRFLCGFLTAWVLYAILDGVWGLIL